MSKPPPPPPPHQTPSNNTRLSKPPPDQHPPVREDKRQALAEFGRICVAAFGIGLVMFFYDVLMSLIVVTIGSVYAVAVLLQVRGADLLLRRMMATVVAVWGGLVRIVGRGLTWLKGGGTKGVEE